VAAFLFLDSKEKENIFICNPPFSARVTMISASSARLVRISLLSRSSKAALVSPAVKTIRLPPAPAAGMIPAWNQGRFQLGIRGDSSLESGAIPGWTQG
jgi:hypothetical protein